MKALHSEVQELYTAKADAYRSFSSTFQYGKGLRALFAGSGLLRPHLRVLDAGCGFGTTTYALVEALRERNFTYQAIDAFDLTPAMLTGFRANLDAHPIADVHFTLRRSLSRKANDHSLRKRTTVASVRARMTTASSFDIAESRA